MGQVAGTVGSIPMHHERRRRGGTSSALQLLHPPFDPVRLRRMVAAEHPLYGLGLACKRGTTGRHQGGRLLGLRGGARTSRSALRHGAARPPGHDREIAPVSHLYREGPGGRNRGRRCLRTARQGACFAPTVCPVRLRRMVGAEHPPYGLWVERLLRAICSPRDADTRTTESPALCGCTGELSLDSLFRQRHDDRGDRQ